MNKSKVLGSVFEFEGRPSLKESFPLAIQHVVAMVVGCVTPALLVSGVAKLSPEDTTLLVQAALILAAFATLIQLFPIFGRIGARLPLVMGVSFAYVPTIMAIGGEFGIAAILGAQLIGAAVAVVFGVFLKFLRPLFPPIVAGTVVFTIGLSLYPTAVNYMAGGTASASFGDPMNWMVAVITLVVVIVLNNFAKGLLKLASILVGLIVGYIVAAFLGMVDLTPVATAAWIQVPAPFHFGMEFQGTAIASMAIMYIVNSVQAVGDMSATTGGAMDRIPTDKELSGGVMCNGFTNILGAMIGGLPTATFSQNVGIVTVTKVINRFVIALAAAIIGLAGFLPKFAALLTTIPQCVLGGATLTVFASIAMTGIKLIASGGLTARTMSVVGISVALGVGVSQAAGCLGGFPQWVIDIFSKNSVIIATILAILLNVLLPKDKKDANGLKH